MSRSTRLTLICHGATAATKTAAFPADEPLLDADSRIVAAIKPVLAHADAVFSAPEQRARQTAVALALDYVADSRFRDVDYGRWAGLSLTEVQANETENLMTWISATEAAPHGGDSIASVIERTSAWLAGQLSTGGHCIVVTHPAVIRSAIVSLLNAPGQSFRNIDVQPWSLTELTSDGRRWSLRSCGHVPRL